MTSFNVHALALRLRTKRGERSLREVVEEIKGVSLSTLSRVENSKPVDIETFLALCDWLDCSPLEFFVDAPLRTEEQTILERIALSLRADSALRSEFVDAVMQLIRVFHRKDASNG
jgi:transcriptional regulator with XRE-family HTH domain